MSASEDSLSPVSWLWLGLLVGLFAIVLIVRLPLNHDLAAHLDWLHRILLGDRLYVDILELNPPLIFYLYYPPALFAHATGSSAITALQVYVVLATTFAILATDRVRRALRPPAAPGDRQVLLWSLLLVLAFIRLPDAGQREHWAFAFACPYFVAAAGQVEGRALRARYAWWVGLMAGVAFSIKPHFVLVPALVEGYLFACGKRAAWRRLECRVAIAFGAAYALWVIAGTDYLRVARIAAGFYSAYERGFWPLVASSAPAYWGLALCLAALFRFEKSVQPLVPVLAVALIGFLTCGLAQAKGWSYHWYPVTAAATWILLLFGWTILSADGARPLARVAASRRAALFSTLATAAMLGFAALLWPAWQSPQGQMLRALADVVRDHAEGRPVAWFTTDATPLFPVLAYAGAHSAFPIGFWPLPGIYRGVAPDADPFPYHRFEEMEAVERSVVTGALRAFERDDPALLVFDARSVKQGFGRTTFDFEEYVQQVPSLAARMSDYEPIGQLGAWRFYQRKRP